MRVRYNHKIEIEMELDGPSKDPSSRADVLTVYVDPVEFGVSDLSFLKKFPNLRTLDVDCDSSNFDFESLQVLSRLPKLKSLHGTIAKDFASTELKGELPFKTLEDLKLKVPQACSGLLARICQITTLKKLDFDVDRSPRGFELSAEQTALFGNLVNLESIRIDGVTDDSLKNISKAKNLRTLGLNDGHLTEKSLETIKSMPKLKNARLYGSGLTRPQRESTGFKF